MTHSSFAIIGAGAWGTALAMHLGRHHPAIYLWGRDPIRMETMQTTRINAHYLPGYTLPETIHCTSDLTKALHQVNTILIAVPSHQFRQALELIKPYLTPQISLVWATKGLESEGPQLLPTLVETVLPTFPYAILSGPSFAKEVAQGLPTAVVIASSDKILAKKLQYQFHQPYFRVYVSTDVTGVSLGGAMKNIIAIAVGVADGMGFCANTRAALMTRGLAEIKRLGTALGAKETTFMGLSGIGDLSLTCMDNQSRNRQLGLAIGRGHSLKEAQQQLGLLSEGVMNTQLICQLAQHHSIYLPICEAVYAILFESKSTQTVVENLLNREVHDEEL